MSRHHPQPGRSRHHPQPGSVASPPPPGKGCARFRNREVSRHHPQPGSVTSPPPPRKITSLPPPGKGWGKRVGPNQFPWAPVEGPLQRTPTWAHSMTNPDAVVWNTGFECAQTGVGRGDDRLFGPFGVTRSSWNLMPRAFVSKVWAPAAQTGYPLPLKLSAAGITGANSL